MLGLDPKVATNDFKIVSFPMKVDGTPDLAGIVVEPPQGRWNVPTITLQGGGGVAVGAGTIIALLLAVSEGRVALPRDSRRERRR